MGLFDIFKKKKTTYNQKESISNMKTTSLCEQNQSNIELINAKLNAEMNTPIYIRQFNESLDIIQTTKNPDTFFRRYEFLIERLTGLEEMQKYVNINCNPNEMKQTIINAKDKYVAELINRMLKETKEKVNSLKHQYDIEREVNNFLSSVEAFNNEMGTQSRECYEQASEYFKTKYLNNSKEIQKLDTGLIELNLNVKINDNSETYLETQFKNIINKVEKSYPSRNGLMIPEIMVLSYAESFNSDGETIQSFWYYRYGLKNAKEILDMLLEKGFICVSPVTDTIKRFSNAKIKDMLRELNLKLSGKKAELLDRLFKNTTIEYLESKVELRGFSITEKGEQELKENAYVMYYHKGNYFTNNCNTDIWWMNKMLHDYPQKTYREIIWEELQKQYKTSLRELSLNGYWHYTNICDIICNFLLEIEGNAEVALKFYAESAYYKINYRMLEEYNNRIKSYNSGIIESKPEIQECVSLDKSSFQKIQKELEISDCEFINKLENIFISFRVETPFLSDSEAAKFIVAKIRKDYDVLDNINYIM